MFSAFAAALPVAPLVTNQGYVYIQNNPILDDSWLGSTLASPRRTISTIVKTPNKVLVGTPRIIDDSWLARLANIKKSPIIIQKNIPTVIQAVPYPVMPIVYTTPNGTLLNNVLAPNTASSYIAPVYIASMNSVFGRSGSVTSQSGDYTTSLVTE